MGEILGLGMSHYPGPIVPDSYMNYGVRLALESERLPAHLKNVTNWPAPMRAEWGDDQALSAASSHRKRLVEGFRRMREEIDAFRPDFVVMFGDDQYENFKEDIFPPFCVYIVDEVNCQPLLPVHRRARSPENVWGEPAEKVFAFKGHPAGAKWLVNRLLQEGFDIPYAYTTRPGNERGLAHSFVQTLLFLDYDRKGFGYPIVPFHVNCYGNRMVRTRLGSTVAGRDGEPEPSSPTPKRCFELGRATGRILRQSPWRIVICGTSSWSHANLTDKHHCFYPDVEADRCRLQELRSGGFRKWGALQGSTIEEAGQNEILNWICLAGAMTELGYEVQVIDFVETHVFNSSKCFAVFSPQKQSSQLHVE